MLETLLFITLAVLLVVLILQVLLLRKKIGIDLTPVEKAFDRTESAVREEFSRNRTESENSGRHTREELAQTLKHSSDKTEERLLLIQEETARGIEKSRTEVETALKSFSETLVKSVTDLGTNQRTQLATVMEQLNKLTDSNEKKLAEIRDGSAMSAKQSREELGLSLKNFNDILVKTINDLGSNQRTQLGNVVEQLGKLTEQNEKKLTEIRDHSQTAAKQSREEIGKTLTTFDQSVSTRMDKLIESNQQKLDALKITIEEKLKAIQEDNGKQLEQMRATVDEKLQGTLEKRLGESFKQVSERLEAVHKGLGEMQQLATGVGDLKKVLTNVKSRGTWGEVQLGAMLEQALTPEQFATNVATKDGSERVEFAIKLPGRSEDRDEIVWLPIDAKFPTEDYQRLLDAHEAGDADAIDTASKNLETRIKGCAWDISEKYVSPPNTTDFGILFLPTEGLFAEVVRRTGLTESIRRECNVVIAGPTTLWALLNSLQMGFRTMAIQKRSGEVWNLLGAVKTEWGKYGDVLAKVQKKLQEASNTIDDAERRTRVIGRKLKSVQELPASDAQAVLMLEDVATADVEE